MRLDRLLAIAVLLINRDRVTARELADRFEVTVRTIYRDIEALSYAGIPVISYQGNNGGFGLVENYRWDRQLLTMNDMVAMLTALKGVNETLEDDELEGAIEKVTSLVPPDRAAELEESLEQFVVDMEPWGGAGRYRERVRVIHRAVVDRRLVRFVYWSAKGEETSRSVEPMTLILKGYSWYLYGYCRLRDGFRIFRVSRMREIELLPERFARRPGSYRECMGYGEDGEATGNRDARVDLHLRFKPTVRFMVQDSYDESECEVRDDGSVDVRVAFPDGEWIASMILSYGDQVEVVSPEWMRERVAAHARRIADLYEKSHQT
ncbi:MAG: helix-turn-helix transcriptional regulator [Spirochaetota bacterium]